MQQHQLTAEQKSRIKKREERRRRERQLREGEYRRRIERFRRQIEEARKRRQRLLLMLLLAILAIQESVLAVFQRSYAYDPDPEPSNWTPDPANDYAPKKGPDDYCDGYSFKQWSRMLDERGIRVSRKAELRAEWMADPDRKHFPQRYRNWSYRPFLGEVMNDLSEQRYQPDALKGLKLLSPPEAHQYLDEVYAINPLDLLHCRAELSADIIHNFKIRATLWEERKRLEAEEAQKAKNDKKPDDDEKKFEP